MKKQEQVVVWCEGSTPSTFSLLNVYFYGENSRIRLKYGAVE